MTRHESGGAGLPGLEVIDLHCHPLPAVDDGPPDLESSLDLLRQAHASGTRRLVATPHLYHPQFPIRREELEAAYGQWQEALESIAASEQGSFLRQIVIEPGAEHWLGPEVLADADRGTARTLGSGRTLLVELPPYLPAEAARAGLARIRAAGYRPLLAHAERYPELVDGGDRLRRLVATGCWLQVNAESVVGGGRTGRRAHRLLSSGRVVAVASDGHDGERRHARLAPVASRLLQSYGEEATRWWLERGPRALISSDLGELEELAIRPDFLTRWRARWRRQRIR